MRGRRGERVEEEEEVEVEKMGLVSDVKALRLWDESYFRFTRASPWFRFVLFVPQRLRVRRIQVNGLVSSAVLFPRPLLVAVVVVAFMLGSLFRIFPVRVFGGSVFFPVEDQQTGAQALERRLSREDEVVGGATGHTAEQRTKPVDLRPEKKNKQHKTLLGLSI